MSKRYPSVVFTCLLAFQPLHALPIRVLAWDQEVSGRKLAIAQDKGAETIHAMHPSRRSPVYQVAGGDKPVMIQALDRLDGDGKPAASGILIPPAVKQPLLLLLPDPKSATGLRLLVLEDDASAFSWGCTRFINACGKKLAFVCEKKAVPLPPSWEPVQVNPAGDPRNLDVQLYFYDQPERPVYSAVWEHNPDERVLVFLVPGEDPRLGPVAMKMISENRRLIAAEKEAAGRAAKPPAAAPAS